MVDQAAPAWNAGIDATTHLRLRMPVRLPARRRVRNLVVEGLATALGAGSLFVVAWLVTRVALPV